jgi:hypothetical protein
LTFRARVIDEPSATVALLLYENITRQKLNPPSNVSAAGVFR